MIDREGLIEPIADIEQRLFDPGPSDSEQRFIDEKTELLNGQVPPELRVYPTKSSRSIGNDQSDQLSGYSDYFVDPFMPRAILSEIDMQGAKEAGEWLLLRGYFMTEGAIVHDTQTSWSIGSIAAAELTSGRGAVKDLLSNTAVIGPYMQIEEGSYRYKKNGIGLWLTEARRKKLADCSLLTK